MEIGFRISFIGVVILIAVFIVACAADTPQAPLENDVTLLLDSEIVLDILKTSNSAEQANVAELNIFTTKVYMCDNYRIDAEVESDLNIIRIKMGGVKTSADCVSNYGYALFSKQVQIFNAKYALYVEYDGVTDEYILDATGDSISLEPKGNQLFTLTLQQFTDDLFNMQSAIELMRPADCLKINSGLLKSKCMSQATA